MPGDRVTGLRPSKRMRIVRAAAPVLRRDGLIDRLAELARPDDGDIVLDANGDIALVGGPMGYTLEGSGPYANPIDIGRALAMRDEWVDDVARQLGVSRDVVLGNPPRIESTRFDSETGMLQVRTTLTMLPRVETTSVRVLVGIGDPDATVDDDGSRLAP